MKQSKLLAFWHGLLVTRPIPALAVLSALTELLIELLGHRNPLSAFVFIFKSPHMFILNAAIIFSTLMFTLLLRRKVFYSLLATLIWLIFGFVNWAALSFRTTPFSARDFSILASGLLIADVYFSPLEIIGMCAAAAAFALFVFLLFTRAPRTENRGDWKKGLLTVAAFAFSLFILGYFGTKDIKLPVQYESINEAFEKRGFPYCFATSIFKYGVSRPENYSKEEVDDLGIGDTPEAGKKPNIILVQLESFFDPALIRGVELEENPIPHFTALRDSCASGYLRMPTLGAGTVNAEFEVLTGMSLDFFGLSEYPYESILRESTCESIAYYLKELGYGTHAIHDYAGSFYGRNEVYPNLGFDDFTSLEYMHGVEFTEKGWPKDAVLTPYILQAMEQTETPDLVFAVSVQCHGKYPDDSEIDDIRFKGNDVFEGAASEQFRYFVKQLQGTDRFLGELIAALETCGEDTVVVAYGDHLPTLDLNADDLISGTLFQTQYFIWSNYGAGVGGADEDLSAYQLTTRLLDVIGMKGGAVTEYHRGHRGLEGYQDGLELLEYDILYGDRITYGGENPYAKTDMKMGLEEIVVQEVVFGEDVVEIRGSGFTEYSVVYIDGKRDEDTVYLSPETLLIPNSPRSLRPESRITVCQTGEDRIILSTASLGP
jgi:hypothetical protein